MLSDSGLTPTCSIIMPCPTKASAQAKVKQQSGQPIFTHVEDIIKDGSVYNDLGKEQTCSESDKGTEETKDELECISLLQRLYTVFLTPHLKQQPLVSNCKYSNIFDLYIHRPRNWKSPTKVSSIRKTLVRAIGRKGNQTYHLLPTTIMVAKDSMRVKWLSQFTNSNLTTMLGCRVRLLHWWKLRYPNSLYIYSKTLFKLPWAP